MNSEIKVINAPIIRLVSRPDIRPLKLEDYLTKDQNTKWEPDYVGAVDAQIICEVAGRTCYGSASFDNPRPGGNARYLEHIIESGHGSVLEHAVWCFTVTGVSRSLSHELVRHRAGMGVSQESQRYVDASDCAFVCPPHVQACKAAWDKEGDPNGGELTAEEGLDCEIYGAWYATCLMAQQSYQDMSNALAKKLTLTMPGAPKRDIRKAANGTARSVLPNSAETKLFLSLNARALRNIIEQRGSAGADIEIRIFANELLKIMRVEAPALFSDYVTMPLSDGTEEISTIHRKV